jgi:5-methyltetrahydrofolate--homocysteine methyltransferase
MEEGYQILKEITEAVINGNASLVINLVNIALKEGIELKTILDALASGVIILGEKLSNKEAFLPELVVGFEAFQEGLKIIEPLLKKLPKEGKKIKVVLGTVKGDIHNIGKNIVKVMLEAAGCEVYDIGVDVSPEEFAEKVTEIDADILGCSTLISLGILSLRKTIEKVRAVRGDKTKILIGGYVTSPELAKELGVIYCKNAYDAVKYVKTLKGGE